MDSQLAVSTFGKMLNSIPSVLSSIPELAGFRLKLETDIKAVGWQHAGQNTEVDFGFHP